VFRDNADAFVWENFHSALVGVVAVIFLPVGLIFDKKKQISLAYHFLRCLLNWNGTQAVIGAMATFFSEH